MFKSLSIFDCNLVLWGLMFFDFENWKLFKGFEFVVLLFIVGLLEDVFVELFVKSFGKVRVLFLFVVMVICVWKEEECGDCRLVGFIGLVLNVFFYIEKLVSVLL